MKSRNSLVPVTVSVQSRACRWRRLQLASFDSLSVGVKATLRIKRLASNGPSNSASFSEVQYLATGISLSFRVSD